MPDTSRAHFVPARYVGHAPVKLSPNPPQPYRDGDGRLRDGDAALILNPGDTLMIPETELRGETFLVDPQGVLARQPNH